jgi:hypothetical protein
MEEKIKILILDIDGVFKTENGLKTLSDNFTKPSELLKKDEYDYPFCPDSIKALNEIIDATGAKIVISSTWRGRGVDELQKIWKRKGMKGEIIDVTPYSKSRIRGKEVESWLHSKGYYYPESYWSSQHCEEAREKCNIETYCIVDDDWDFFILQEPHYVNTPAYYGLAGEGIKEKIIEILNKKNVR